MEYAYACNSPRRMSKKLLSVVASRMGDWRTGRGTGRGWRLIFLRTFCSRLEFFRGEHLSPSTFVRELMLHNRAKLIMAFRVRQTRLDGQLHRYTSWCLGLGFLICRMGRILAPKATKTGVWLVSYWEGVALPAAPWNPHGGTFSSALSVGREFVFTGQSRTSRSGPRGAGSQRLHRSLASPCSLRAPPGPLSTLRARLYDPSTSSPAPLLQLRSPPILLLIDS